MLPDCIRRTPQERYGARLARDAAPEFGRDGDEFVSESKPLAIAARPISGREHVAQFLRVTLKPDPLGAASLRQLHTRYLVWCRSRAVDPLPAAELGQHLRAIVDTIGLQCEPGVRDVVVRGAAIAD